MLEFSHGSEWALRKQPIAAAPDGHTVLSGHPDGGVRLWDVETGKEIRHLAGHGDSVDSVAFSPDGKRLASAGHDQTVRVWDAATGKSLAVLKPQADVIRALAFSPDGRFLVLGSNDKTILILMLPTNSKPPEKDSLRQK
jgi:WD40 repeat protein